MPAWSYPGFAGRGGGPLGFPAVREDARGVHHPGRGLRRRHGHYRRNGRGLVGALHGKAWIPARWYDNIENGVMGGMRSWPWHGGWRGSTFGRRNNAAWYNGVMSVGALSQFPAILTKPVLRL